MLWVLNRSPSWRNKKNIYLIPTFILTYELYISDTQAGMSLSCPHIYRVYLMIMMMMMMMMRFKDSTHGGHLHQNSIFYLY